MRLLSTRTRERIEAANSITEVVRPLERQADVAGLADWAWVPTPGHTGPRRLPASPWRVLLAGDAALTVDLNSVGGVPLGQQRVTGPPWYDLELAGGEAVGRGAGGPGAKGAGVRPRTTVNGRDTAALHDLAQGEVAAGHGGWFGVKRDVAAPRPGEGPASPCPENPGRTALGALPCRFNLRVRVRFGWLASALARIRRRRAMSTRTDRASTLRSDEIHGQVSKGFEPVREAFAENFSRRKELGAACCVYHHGEKVVDLWGGIRNKATGEPWAEDTMVLVFSATKGFAAMTMALLHSRGLLDYDERVCTYWPEFAQNGKQNLTVRQLLAHKPGCSPSTSGSIGA